MQLLNSNYEYSEFEYEELQDALDKAERYTPGVSNYQYQQNQLNKEIARFLLKPYINKKRWWINSQQDQILSWLVKNIIQILKNQFSVDLEAFGKKAIGLFKCKHFAIMSMYLRPSYGLLNDKHFIPTTQAQDIVWGG